MSTSETVPVDELVRLVASAPDPFTEIVIVNSKFALEASGFGRVEKALLPGIYRVDFKAGNAREHKFALLEPQSPGGVVAITGGNVAFTSTSLLLEEMAAPHGDGGAGLKRLVGEWFHAPSRSFGTGARILWCTRRPADAAPDDAVDTKVHLLSGVTVVDARGNDLVDLGELAKYSDAHGMWGTCVDLAPGPYRLRYPLSNCRIEQSLVVAPGWGTLALLPMRLSGGPEVAPELDLPRASMLMVPLEAATLDERFVRWTEMARIALTEYRQSGLPAEIAEMVEAKTESPMLGVIGAHLLTLQRVPENDRIRALVDRLTSLLGNLPDLLALRIWLGEDPATWSPEARVALEQPPLLRQSWSILTKASADHPSVIPAGSLSSRIADSLWGGGAWLLWEAKDAVPTLAALGTSSRGRAESVGDFSDAAFRGVARGINTSLDFGVGGASPSLGLDDLARVAGNWYEVVRAAGGVAEYARRNALTGAERLLLQHMCVAVESSRDNEGAIRRSSAGGHRGDNEQHGRPKLRSMFERKRLVQALGIPASSIDAAFSGLAERLGGSGPVPTEDPDDANKGRFGRRTERNARRIVATVSSLADDPDWFEVRVVVESTDAGKPLVGSVRFHVHPTFPVPVSTVEVENGTAEWNGLAWGAFTVGATCDDGATALEIDLAQLADAPEVFRGR